MSSGSIGKARLLAATGRRTACSSSTMGQKSRVVSSSAATSNALSNFAHNHDGHAVHRTGTSVAAMRSYGSFRSSIGVGADMDITNTKYSAAVANNKYLGQQQQQHQRSDYTTTARRLRPRRRNYSMSLPASSDLSAAAAASAEEAAGERLEDQQTNTNPPNYDDLPMKMEELAALASQRTTPLSLQNMYRYASVGKPAQRLRNAQFLHRELPIRIAQRAVDLLTLPHGLSATPQVRSVATVYLKYLQRLQECPCPQTAEQEHHFTDVLRSMVLDRISIPSAIAAGISTLRDRRKEHIGLDVRRLREMEEALYRFFTARVGLRFLTEHHILSDDRRDLNEDLRVQQSCLENVPIESSGDAGDDNTDYLGCIQKNCDPVREARRVADQVRTHCEEAYGIAPDVDIVDCTARKDADIDFTYVPHHLQYMLSELLKNSCRASVRTYLHELVSDVHKDDDDNATSKPKEPPVVPTIRVVVVKGAEDVTIKIADKAGGIPRSAAKKVWAFAHTNVDDSAIETEQETEFETDEFTGSAIRGFGLPLARIYARYFGGELTLKSMEGYGVDAYLYLPVLGSACENLPHRVTHSPGNLDSTPLASTTGSYGGERARDEDFAEATKAGSIDHLAKKAL
mmetsp:Transcript_7211/g.15737  ORF Transcript_7211/g.15737 Transcript_7211/m.15737 type:complete len:628 (+) Transcript_7211:108-1991(+)